MGNKVGIEYASFGLQGRRPTMEDAETTITNYGGKPTQAFFGIFDGHVGPQCSKYVSQQLPKLLLKESSFASDTKEALTSAFMKCDKEWLTKAKAANPILKDGSTGVVVLLKDEKIYCANTGDSRSVMYQAGKVVPLSFDQKPEDPAEQRRIEKNGGVVLMGRVQGEIAVARSFGDIAMKNQDTCEPKYLTPEPDVREFDLTEDTAFIILACDGVWDKLSNEDACEFVRKKLDGGASLKAACQALCEEAYNKGSQDNISAVLVGFKNSKPGSLSAPPTPKAEEPQKTSPREETRERKKSAKVKEALQGEK